MFESVLATVMLEALALLLVVCAIIYVLLSIIYLLLRAAYNRALDKTAKWVGGIHRNLTKRGNYAKNRS
jgi:hypothetical protein